MKTLSYLAAMLFISFCYFIPSASAQHYSLDTTFTHRGIDTFGGDIPSGYIHRPQFILPQVDNKIVIVGSITYASSVEIMRLNNNGSPDSTFNDSGKVVVTQPYTIALPSCATLYDTAKVVVASTFLDNSTGWYYMSVYDFNSNGSLNTGFGTGGVAHIGLSGAPVYTSPVSCGVQIDGKIVVLGQTVEPATGLEKYGLVRLLANGTVDPSYGTGGIILDPYIMLDTQTSTSVSTAYARCGYMQQTDNKFVVAGTFLDSIDIYNAYQCFIVRHNMDGSPDLTFGDANGITLIKEANQDYEALAIATDSAGNSYILAHIAHFLPPFSDSNFAVIKLDHNGHRAAHYGYNGVAYLQLQNADAYPSGFTVQKDGRAILPGIYHDYSSGNFADKFLAYRLDTVGNLDTSFNTGGMVTAKRDSSNNDLCIAAAVQPDGKILLAGYDTLTATSVCMRFTNYRNVVPATVPHIQAADQSLFSGYVFPNPVFNRELHIHYTNGAQAAPGALQLFDADGRSWDVRSVLLSNGSGDISYSIPASVPTGVYYLVLKNVLGEKQTHPVTVLN